MSSDENYRRLRAELDGRLKSDDRLKALAEKISAGTADLTDTAKYSQIVSHILGDVISKNIGEIKVPLGKELVCKELLKDHYDMINGVIGKVQVSVDEKLGIHLNTVKAPFPTERVDKAAHSLEDPTVPEETIKRRARSATENIANSMHDDTIKENAKWRSKAGLDTYLVRDAGGGCCKWCQALEGRYKYAEAPDGIFRRHDNCTCTVTYECGRQRQDVWSKRTWQASEKELQQRRVAAEAAKPVKISPEQAQAINEQSRPTVYTKEQAQELEKQIIEFNSLQNEYLKGSSEIKFERVDGSGKISKELANEYRKEYDRFVEHFGVLTRLKGIDIAPYADDNVYGRYYPESRNIVIYGAGGKNGNQFLIQTAQEHKKNGEWSTGVKYHSFRHELGHALQDELASTDSNWSIKFEEIEKLRLRTVESLTNKDGSVNIKEIGNRLSKYGFTNTKDFISESVAEYVQNPKKARSISKQVVEILKRGDDYYANVNT